MVVEKFKNDCTNIEESGNKIGSISRNFEVIFGSWEKCKHQEILEKIVKVFQ